MKISRSFMIFVVVLLIFGLTACTRSRPATEQPEEGGTPSSPTDVMDQLNMLATQTALAQTTEGETAEPTDAVPVDTTPVIVETVTPEPTTPPTQVVVPTATPGIPASYTLQKGEFPYCIARRFNVDPGEILSINGLSSATRYYPPGTTLTIPQTGKPFPGNRSLRAHPTTYTAGAGDTIYSVACFFGDVDPNAIAAANNLVPPYRLTPGQGLNIP
jgi:LysM repeat protein